MPMNFHVLASVCDILVTSLRVSEPGTKMFLHQLPNTAICRARKEQTHSSYKILQFGLYVCLVQSCKFFNIGESIDFENVLGVKWMIMEGRERQVGVVDVTEVHEYESSYV